LDTDVVGKEKDRRKRGNLRLEGATLEWRRGPRGEEEGVLTLHRNQSKMSVIRENYEVCEKNGGKSTKEKDTRG